MLSECGVYEALIPRNEWWWPSPSRADRVMPYGPRNIFGLARYSIWKVPTNVLYPHNEDPSRTTSVTIGSYALTIYHLPE